ncbi:cobalamin biosynthesis protein CbiG [bacterium]|nr:MAG: cobalamin biosynthesis protein CbiG [bacterium]
MTTPPGGSGELYAIALTKTGAKTALRLAGATGAKVYLPERFATGEAIPFSEPVASLIARLWKKSRGLFLVMASGIAVRSIAPLLKDKYTDPAVILLDSEGSFAVPLLSGHLGGANELAQELAQELGLQAVITTATDTAKKPAVEVWAAKKGWAIENRGAVRLINSAWVNGDGVGLYLDPLLSLDLVEDIAEHLAFISTGAGEARSYGGPLIAVTPRLEELPGALFVRPKVLCLGVGCRLGADPKTVREGILGALASSGLSPLCAAMVASVDAKKNEAALIELAKSLGAPFLTFSSETLAKFETPNPSRRVMEAVGTSSVSEAAALAGSSGGSLLIEKKSGGVWTLAVALIAAENK